MLRDTYIHDKGRRMVMDKPGDRMGSIDLPYPRNRHHDRDAGQISFIIQGIVTVFFLQNPRKDAAFPRDSNNNTYAWFLLYGHLSACDGNSIVLSYQKP